jgi:ligand-binding SRPBCC domain-containing protein
MKKPDHFTDEQLNGSFKMMKHEHHFKPCDNGTIMIDLFEYEVPYGLLGKIFDKFYLSKYILRLLHQRNKTIREYGESDKWKRLLIK